MKVIDFATISIGGSAFIRRVSAPIADVLDEAVASTKFECGDGEWLQEDEILRLDKEPKLDGVLAGVVAGVLVFVGQWAAKKALDEIYSARIRPALERLFQTIGGQVPAETPVPRTLLVLGLWLASQRCLVLVKIKAGDYVELAELVGDAWQALHRGATEAIAARAAAEVRVLVVSSSPAAEDVAVYRTLQEALEAADD